MAVDTISEGEAALKQLFFHAAASSISKIRAVNALTRQAGFPKAGGEPEVVPREPHPSHSVMFGEFQRHRKDHRMDVHVEMAVHMGQLKSGGMKSLELRGKLLERAASRADLEK